MYITVHVYVYIYICIFSYYKLVHKGAVQNFQPQWTHDKVWQAWQNLLLLKMFYHFYLWEDDKRFVFRNQLKIVCVCVCVSRQGYITDKVPVEVLIEKYLPMEYRRMLIPIATSGNVVIPKQK